MSEDKNKRRDRIKEAEIATGMRTAIMVDGSYFLKRYRKIYGEIENAQKTVKDFYTMVHKHVTGKSLYRIFYYDAPPLDKKVHLPISKTFIDYSNSKLAVFRREFFNELKRKVALRLGKLKDYGGWVLKQQITKDLIKGKKAVNEITDDDFNYNVRQKEVDIRIGLDIASLAYKQLVRQIILISGDSDFVPAAKVARREGIDFILDPMWQHVDDGLLEHIDGMSSTCPKPRSSS